MQRIVILLFPLLFGLKAFAQPLYPVKVQNRWGLMDAEGAIVLPTIYEAIGEFKKYGYAVMQRAGKVGLLDQDGIEIVLPQYEDLKVLDSTLVAVMDQEEWMVINLKGKVVLEKGYERVSVWPSGFLGYRKEHKWGIVNREGERICSPKYDEIQWKEEGYFQTKVEQNFGLLTTEGSIILEALCDEIKIYNDSLFFFQVGRYWGAVNREGKELIPTNYNVYHRISDNFIRLSRDRKHYCYSIPAERLITDGEYDNFYPFSSNKVLCKKDRLLGLLNLDGDLVLPARYNEIQSFNARHYRVKVEQKWGVVSDESVMIIPLEYDYIAPPKGKVCLAKKGFFFGVLNDLGENPVPFEFGRIELFADQARAFKGEAMSLFHFDEDGLSKEENAFKKHFTITIGGRNRVARQRLGFDDSENNYLLDDFEWFYSSREDKWGLRRLDDGQEQIKPTFDEIRVVKEHGFTIVGIEKYEYFNFERTTYRFEMMYGVVNNSVGLLVTGLNLWDIRLRDFDQGLNTARCIFSNGRHGLISKNPIGLILKKDYAYIGEFHHGVARMSVKGQLSGSLKQKERQLESLPEYLSGLMSNNYMVDYTLYDQEFNMDARLVCEGCKFGFIDTAAQIVVQNQYSFAHNFVNNVGIVESEGKWGLVNREDRELIACRYDGIHFLENTDNTILRVYTNKLKYGLIDTLGQVAVNLIYDKIGAFRESRLAVKRKNVWGFVNKNGVEVIPCRFKRVRYFSEGLAAVQLRRKWGFVDQQGDVVIDYKYHQLGNFKDGLAWAKTRHGYAYLNPEGKMVIKNKFDKAFDFEENIARVVVDGKWGLINKEGEYILRPKYTQIEAFNEYGLAVARYGNNNIRYGLINRSGNMITVHNFKKIEAFSEGLAAVKYKNGYGFVDHRGHMVISSKYSRVSKFSNGRAVVQKDGVCGYIDREGNEVVGLEYSKCLDFEEGRAVVYKGYKQGGVIDTAGNYIIEPSINRILDFSQGRGLVRDGNYRFYYITEEARVYDGFYQKAGEFRHGVAVVQSNGQW
ncbi:MAG: WG repeat-containing protein, partial [Bacteroidota bacterium]